MSKLTNYLAETAEEDQMVFGPANENSCKLVPEFEDQYEKIFLIENNLRERARSMYFPRVFDKNKIGLYMFLESYKK